MSKMGRERVTAGESYCDRVARRGLFRGALDALGKMGGLAVIPAAPQAFVSSANGLRLALAK